MSAVAVTPGRDEISGLRFFAVQLSLNGWKLASLKRFFCPSKMLALPYQTDYVE